MIDGDAGKLYSMLLLKLSLPSTCNTEQVQLAPRVGTHLQHPRVTSRVPRIKPEVRIDSYGAREINVESRRSCSTDPFQIKVVAESQRTTIHLGMMLCKNKEQITRYFWKPNGRGICNRRIATVCVVNQKLPTLICTWNKRGSGIKKKLIRGASRYSV